MEQLVSKSRYVWPKFYVLILNIMLFRYFFKFGTMLSRPSKSYFILCKLKIQNFMKNKLDYIYIHIDNSNHIDYSDNSITNHNSSLLAYCVKCSFLKTSRIYQYKRFNFTVSNAVEYANGCVAASGAHGDGSNMPIIRKKERDYEGMFEFRKEDINVVIRHLVIGKCYFSLNKFSNKDYLITFFYSHYTYDFRIHKFISNISVSFRAETPNSGDIVTGLAGLHHLHVH